MARLPLKWKELISLGAIAIIGQGCFADTLSRSPELIAEKDNTFASCHVREPCQQSLKLESPTFLDDIGILNLTGEMPPGLNLTFEMVIPDPSQPISRDNLPVSYVVLDGTPTTAGSYKFDLNVGCCRTMTGYLEDEWGRFYIEVLEQEQSPAPL